jgi:hypothetical protein
VLKKKDEDADSLIGLSTAKKGGKKGKKGADKREDKPVCQPRVLLLDLLCMPCFWCSEISPIGSRAHALLEPLYFHLWISINGACFHECYSHQH